MQVEHIVLLLFFVLATSITTMLALFAYSRRTRPGAREFCVFMLAVAVYALGTAFEVASVSLPQVKFCLHIEYLGAAFLPFLWIVQTIRYAGLHDSVKKTMVQVLLAFSALILLSELTNDFHQLFYHEIAGGEEDIPFALIEGGLWYWIFLYYMSAAIMVGNVLIFRVWRKTAVFDRLRVGCFFVVSLLPLLAQTLVLSGNSPWKINLTPLAFTVVGLFYCWLELRRRSFDLENIAQEKMYELMSEGMVVMDAGHTIIQFNLAAEKMLDGLNDASIGYAFSETFPTRAELINQLQTNVEQIEFCIKDGMKIKWLESRLSCIYHSNEELIGKILILTDITKYRQAQSHMIRSEKMAALGKLVANVTKELNAPLHNIQSTSETIEAWFVVFGKQITDLFATIDNSQKELLLEMLDKVKDAPRLTTKEEQESLLSVTRVLWENGLDENNKSARYLIKLDRTEDIQAFIPIMRDERASAVLEFVLEIALQRKNLQGILRAVDRTARLVNALKKFSHANMENKAVMVDIQGDIETIMQLYGNALRRGVELVTDFKPIPKYLGNQTELQQVWITLLQNAIQAVRGKGRVVVVTEEQKDELIVRFVDNGSGITADSIPKLFDPYFSNPRTGESEGYSLAICKEIVERHRGRLEVESFSGQTQFSVYLPLVIY